MKVHKFWVIFIDVMGKTRGKTVHASSAYDAWQLIADCGYTVLYVC